MDIFVQHLIAFSDVYRFSYKKRNANILQFRAINYFDGVSDVVDSEGETLFKSGKLGLFDSRGVRVTQLIDSRMTQLLVV